MKWYHYLKIAGLITPLIAPRASTIFFGIAIHLLADFSCQSNWQATKAGNHKALLFHSLIAGSLPGLAIGLNAGNPMAALVFGLVGFVTHYAIDHQNKFSLPLALGVTVDQILHILVIVVLVGAL